jgi:ribonucleoside-diphosphate reductase alpha chain
MRLPTIPSSALSKARRSLIGTKKWEGIAMTAPHPISVRQRLPNRRAAFSSDIEFKGLRYRVTAGYFDDGSLAEIFVSSQKAGSTSDVAARDAGILVSLCLQHGCSANALARALSRNSDGSASSVIGAVLDRIITETERAR